MVVTARPSACTAKSEHDFTAAPSSRTVHAPHWLVSQPTCVPVSPSTSRRKWTRSNRGSTFWVSLCPLTLRVTEVKSPPCRGERLGGAPALGGRSVNTPTVGGQHAPRRRAAYCSPASTETLLTHFFSTQAGATRSRGGRHVGWGQRRPALQVAMRA